MNEFQQWLAAAGIQVSEVATDHRQYYLPDDEHPRLVEMFAVQNYHHLLFRCVNCDMLRGCPTLPAHDSEVITKEFLTQHLLEDVHDREITGAMAVLQ